MHHGSARDDGSIEPDDFEQPAVAKVQVTRPAVGIGFGFSHQVGLDPDEISDVFASGARLGNRERDVINDGAVWKSEDWHDFSWQRD
jgi:hypothetical protein